MDDFDSLVDDSQHAAPIAGGPTAANQNTMQAPDSMDFDSMVDDGEKYGTPGQMAITAVEGAAHGVAGPLATLAEKHILGVNEQDINMRRETNPITHGVGQAVGLGAGLLTGTGEGALMVKAGELAAGAVGLGKGLETASLGYKVGSAAVAQAAEMAVLSGSDEVSKLILNDPNTSAESAIANVGLAAVLGGATGGLLEGTVKPLWNATMGPKVTELLDGFTKHVNGEQRLILPDTVEKSIKDLGIEVSPEMRAALSNDPKMVEMYKVLKETQNPKMEAAVNKLYTDASDSVMGSLKLSPDDVLVYSENEAGHDLLNTFKSEFKGKYGDFEPKYLAQKVEAAKIKVADEVRLRSYDKLMEDAISKIGTDSPLYAEYTHWGNRMLAKDSVGGMDMLKTELGNEITKAKVAVDYNKVNALTDIKRSISDLQENEILKQASVLEKSGVEYGSALGRDMVRERQVLSQQYREFAEMSDELTSHIGAGNFSGAKTLENKLSERFSAEQLLNKFSIKGNADFIPFLAKNFPETLQNVKENELKRLLKPAMLSAKGESPVNIKKLSDIINKGMAGQKEYMETVLPPGAMDRVKAAQALTEALPNPKSSGTAGWMTKTMKDMPRSAMAALGALNHGTIGGGIAGGILGELAQRLGRDAPDALRLGMMKYMGSTQPVKAEGFKAMVDFFSNTYKGENTLSKATSAVFKSGAQVLGTGLIPDDKDRVTLDKAVTRLQKNPGQFQPGKDDLGHYLPNHQMAQVESTTRALQYLQSIKPQGYRPTPLDREIPPTKAQEARYHRALDIAQQPALVLQHVKDGTLQTSDIQDLHNLYPALYQSMVQKLSNQMTTAQSNEEPIPYKTRMGISLFLGQPVDSTMTPQAIMAAQPQPKAPQGGQPNMKRGSMQKLGKTNETYQTPLQSSEADSSKHRRQ